MSDSDFQISYEDKRRNRQELVASLHRREIENFEAILLTNFSNYVGACLPNGTRLALLAKASPCATADNITIIILNG
jgi:hypothetical protein